MSDALSDLRQDEELAQLLRKIERLERKFIAEPTQPRATELISLLKQYARARHGYWSGPNRLLAYEKIARLTLEPLEQVAAWLAACKEGIALRTGNDFVLDKQVFDRLLESWVRSAQCGPFAHSVFRLKGLNADVRRETCRTCPFFSNYCGVVQCRSCDPEELRVRKEFAARGETITEG